MAQWIALLPDMKTTGACLHVLPLDLRSAACLWVLENVSPQQQNSLNSEVKRGHVKNVLDMKEPPAIKRSPDPHYHS